MKPFAVAAEQYALIGSDNLKTRKRRNSDENRRVCVPVFSFTPKEKNEL